MINFRFSYQAISAAQSETGVAQVANDIALLKLNSTVSRLDVLPICEKPNPKHSKLVAIGMGYNTSFRSREELLIQVMKGIPVDPDVLQEVQLRETGSCLNISIGKYNMFNQLMSRLKPTIVSKKIRNQKNSILSIFKFYLSKFFAAFLDLKKLISGFG